MRIGLANLKGRASVVLGERVLADEPLEPRALQRGRVARDGRKCARQRRSRGGKKQR